MIGRPASACHHHGARSPRPGGRDQAQPLAPICGCSSAALSAIAPPSEWPMTVARSISRILEQAREELAVEVDQRLLRLQQRLVRAPERRDVDRDHAVVVRAGGARPAASRRHVSANPCSSSDRRARTRRRPRGSRRRRRRAAASPASCPLASCSPGCVADRATDIAAEVLCSAAASLLLLLSDRRSDGRSAAPRYAVRRDAVPELHVARTSSRFVHEDDEAEPPPTNPCCAAPNASTSPRARSSCRRTTADLIGITEFPFVTSARPPPETS